MSNRIPVTYVASSSHSGSTLLALLADQHPAIASVGETAVKPRLRREGKAALHPCSCGAPLQRCTFWQAIFQDVSASGARFDAHCWSNDYRFEHRWIDLLLTRETSHRTLLWLRQYARHHLPAYRTRMARIDKVNVAFIRAVLARTGATVFFDGTKLLTRLRHLLTIAELDVKVVRLVRDVRGIAASAKRRGESATAAARVWHNDQAAILRLLATLPQQRTMLMRYEDLCGAPRDTLHRLWQFCGVTPIDVPLVADARDHHLIGNRMRLAGAVALEVDDSWRQQLDRHEERGVLRIGGGFNRQFGYV